MIDFDIRDGLARLFDESVDVAVRGDGFAVVTPIEYPDGDGVVVSVREEGGAYAVTDSGEADARLALRHVGTTAISVQAADICRRMGATFEEGCVVARVRERQDLAEVCWLVARAAAAIAEAATFHKPARPTEREFADIVVDRMQARKLTIERGRPLAGVSGHKYKTSLYVPERHAVLEPVGGPQAWNVASWVYVEFGDLREANGYRLIAVLDDRDEAPSDDVSRLLRQVGAVASWSQADTWIAGLVDDTLL